MRRPALRFGPFKRRPAPAVGRATAPIAVSAASGAEATPIIVDVARLEAEVRRIIADLRARPTQEKEDRAGIEIATMPAAERDLVPGILMRILAEESGRGGKAV